MSLNGFKQAGPSQIGSMMNEAADHVRRKKRAERSREQAVARVQNMLGMQHKDFGPTQWAFVETVERSMQGSVGPRNRLPKRGGFRLPSEAWRR